MNQQPLGSSATAAPVELTLNQGQQDAADAFFQFLFSNDREMGISGPGGVGKTFLMGHMIDMIMPRYLETCKLMGIAPAYDSIVMTATTNKAAEQLSQATGKPAETIHSFLNLKVKDDYKTGKTTLTRTDRSKIHSRLIVFIDECSMIDMQLYQLILALTMNCKIVYVGDHCQLAPVMETLSPVYKQRIPFYNLTEPMRTKIPELHALNQQLRNTVETGQFDPIQTVPGIIDWLDDVDMEAEIQAHFQSQHHANRICAYTNARVNAYNEHIRNMRLLPDFYTIGEELVNNTACHLKGAMLTVEESVTIIDLDPVSTMIPLDEGVDIEVCYATVQTSLGAIHEKVILPVDRNHFHDLMKYFGNQKKWAPYFMLKNDFADLRPKDASTVYKAQGSSYDVTFVDLGNISTCHNAQQVARMLYVALSRARHRVILYGTLAEKYGGVIT